MNIQIKNRQSTIGNRQFVGAFSLTEVLIAVGTLAIGMLFIASVFPAGLYFTTVSSERTIAAVAAEDAFATIKLYEEGFNISGLSNTSQTPIESISSIYSGEYGYPSHGGIEQKKFWWSAICRKIDTNDVQITVFVSRKIGQTTQYHGGDGTRPVAVKVGVNGIVGNNELTITGDKTQINDDYTIVDDSSGQIYRVLERYKSPDNIIRLDKPWLQNGNTFVWVIPPPLGGGRYPCIAVYQKVVRF